MNARKEFLQLKVLGLGIAEDIGAAIAIELDHIIYAPLHDFHGNCIALVSPSGEITERYQIDAFGKERSSASFPKNPWRFSSKRQEEGLVFFGLRCYDIELERWLTPDPAGFIDGSNLYAYVLNNPLNRLDVLGLTCSTIIAPPPWLYPWDVLPTPSAAQLSLIEIQQSVRQNRKILNIYADGVQTDWAVICGHLHKMQFSAQELKTGKVKLFDHFAELVPQTGNSIGLVLFQNGINTSPKEFQGMLRSIADKIPEGMRCRQNIGQKNERNKKLFVLKFFSC